MFRPYNAMGKKKIPGGGVYIFPPMKNRIIGIPVRRESSYSAEVCCFIFFNWELLERFLKLLTWYYKPIKIILYKNYNQSQWF